MKRAVKRAAIAASDRLIVVADHSKVGRAHLSNIAPLSAAEVFVTDASAELPSLRAVSSAGVVIVNVPAYIDLEKEVAL